MLNGKDDETGYKADAGICWPAEFSRTIAPEILQDWDWGRIEKLTESGFDHQAAVFFAKHESSKREELARVIGVGKALLAHVHWEIEEAGGGYFCTLEIGSPPENLPQLDFWGMHINWSELQAREAGR